MTSSSRQSAPQRSSEPSAGAGTPAPYGQACVNCSRAKCRCILRLEGGSCERCFRLGKECRAITPARKRNAGPGAEGGNGSGKRARERDRERERESQAARTAMLEDKLENLVSLLKREKEGNGAANGEAGTGANGLPAGQGSTPGGSSESSSTMPSQPQTLPNPAPCAINSNISFAPQPNSLILDRRTTEPSPPEAEEYLHSFRTQHLRFLPFFHILPQTTSEELRVERPFLWLSVMAVSTRSVNMAERLKERLKRELALRLVVENEKNLDMMQGILVLVLWASRHATPGVKPFLVLFTHMGLGILGDLGLTKAQPDENFFNMCFKMYGGKPISPRPRSMDERRALLAAFFVSANMKQFVGKMDSLRWSPYMEECLRMLESQKEAPGDEGFAAFIKLQKISDDAIDAAEGRDRTECAPRRFYLRGQLMQLEKIRRGISAELWSNPILQAHYHNTQLTIHQPTALRSSTQFSHPSPLSPTFSRIDHLFTVLSCTRAWFDVFLAIPETDLPFLPFATFTHISQSMVTLLSLTTLDDPAWDKRMVRQTIDVLDVLDRIRERFEKAARVNRFVQEGEGTGPGENLFTKAERVLRGMREIWAMQVSRSEAGGGGGGGGGVAAAAHAAGSSEDLPSGVTSAAGSTAMAAMGAGSSGVPGATGPVGLEGAMEGAASVVFDSSMWDNAWMGGDMFFDIGSMPATWDSSL